MHCWGSCKSFASLATPGSLIFVNLCVWFSAEANKSDDDDEMLIWLPISVANICDNIIIIIMILIVIMLVLIITINIINVINTLHIASDISRPSLESLNTIFVFVVLYSVVYTVLQLFR